MLQNKLEQASKEASTRRLKGALIIVGIALFVGLAVVSVSLYQVATDLLRELSTEGSQASGTSLSKGGKNSARSGVANHPAWSALEGHASDDAPTQQSQPSINQEHKSPQKAIEQTAWPPQIKTEPSVTSSIETVSLSVGQGFKNRDSFKIALKSFEQAIEPKLKTDGFLNWSAESQRDLLFLKDSAISAFSAGDYAQALALVQKATELAGERLNAKKAAFDQAFEDATNAKLAEDYETAKESIRRALLLSPESPETQKLSSDIDALPNVIKYLRAVKIAKKENNLQQELESLRKVLELDSDRKAIQERVLFISTEINERAFARQIWNGLSHVKNRQLKSAQENLVAARHLFPKRDETSILGAKIATLKSNLKTEQLIDAAKLASAKDDWSQSLELFGRAKEIQPNNQFAVEGQILAFSIVSSHDQISRHLDAPHRLSSTNVAAGVSRLIEKSRALAGNSKSLDQETANLADVFASFMVEVPVSVVSDGLSRVLVRGVGRIGITKEKVIKLRPGTYTFEGSRTGYKSKLVRVNIPPRANQIRVEVVCDERI